MTVLEIGVGTHQVDVTADLSRILETALRQHPHIQNIVLASPQGLVVAYRSRVGARGMALSALAPLLHDAGETVFMELSLSPLSEVMLLGPNGAVYQVRSEDSRYYVLISAVGEANLGLLRMVASDVERKASEAIKLI